MSAETRAQVDKTYSRYGREEAIATHGEKLVTEYEALIS